MVEINYSLPIHVSISDDSHAVIAAHNGNRIARSIGCSVVEQTAISTAILEVARNIFKYAQSGTIILDIIEQESLRGVLVTAVDNGPGIENLELAMTDGYSTGKTLGMGLPGAKRLMDTFEIDSIIGQGTTIKMKKWKYD